MDPQTGRFRVSLFNFHYTLGAGSCASELGLKVFCELKVNWKDFLQKIFAIHFTCSESCALSKVNCKQRKSIGTPISQLNP